MSDEIPEYLRDTHVIQFREGPTTRPDFNNGEPFYTLRFQQSGPLMGEDAYERDIERYAKKTIGKLLKRLGIEWQAAPTSFCVSAIMFNATPEQREALREIEDGTQRVIPYATIHERNKARIAKLREENQRRDYEKAKETYLRLKPICEPDPA